MAPAASLPPEGQADPKSRQKQGNQKDSEAPVSSEIRRAAVRIGVIDTDTERRIRAEERREQEAFFVSALVRIGDIAGEIRAAMDERDGTRQGFEDVLDMLLRRLNIEVWRARWDTGYQGGDKRIGIVDSEVTS